ncbi:MAG TPA: hypothetical protein VF712_05505 [Thermoleophilaceae bacterium]|jgi:hypothetical protein
MTASTIFQPVNNAVLPSQSGEGFVLEESIQFSGGDALIGFSASGWSSSVGEISMELWLDGQPTGGRLAIYANQTAMHLSLGHTWVWCRDLAPGQHTIALMAGPTTITDLNDRACVTVWEMGDGCAVRFTDDAPCPPGTGDVLMKYAVETSGGEQVLICAGASGWAGSNAMVVGASVQLDGAPLVSTEVFANASGMHLATVPTAVVAAGLPRGSHAVMIEAAATTATDGGDTAHLAVVEWVDPSQAPTVLATLENVAAQSQSGEGQPVARTTFQSSGGTLLVSVNVSGWTEGTNVPLMVGVQVDGTSLGFVEMFANPKETHMAMVSNDLVLSGVAAGPHTLTLIGEANTNTDYNDRVSVLMMEFPAG